MKNEMLQICQELENNFDEKLERYEDRLNKLNEEIGTRLLNMKHQHSDDNEIEELQELLAKQKRTLRLMQAKLRVIHDNSIELLESLGVEIKQRFPDMRRKIEHSESYEQAEIEIRKEAHSGSDSFKDFLKAIFMWKDTPEERLENKGQL